MSSAQARHRVGCSSRESVQGRVGASKGGCTAGAAHETQVLKRILDRRLKYVKILHKKQFEKISKVSLLAKNATRLCKSMGNLSFKTRVSWVIERCEWWELLLKLGGLEKLLTS